MKYQKAIFGHDRVNASYSPNYPLSKNATKATAAKPDQLEKVETKN
jgi:hypothetical protein